MCEWGNYNYPRWSVAHEWWAPGPHTFECHKTHVTDVLGTSGSGSSMSSKLVSISSSLMCIRFKSIFGSLTLGLVATFLTWVSLACALCSPGPIPLDRILVVLSSLPALWTLFEQVQYLMVSVAPPSGRVAWFLPVWFYLTGQNGFNLASFSQT